MKEHREILKSWSDEKAEYEYEMRVWFTFPDGKRGPIQDTFHGDRQWAMNQSRHYKIPIQSSGDDD